MTRSSSTPKSKLAAAAARWLLTVACCCGSLAALSCNDETPPPQPARFNRPNRVDFVCVNGTQIVARKLCPYDGPLARHALVTQAGRGEIAVVNLSTGQVIDSRRDIPGYTFVPVGETPTAIVVPPVRAAHTYVANFGSRDVRVLRTRALIATVSEQADAQRVMLTADDGTLLAPTDMVLAPDETALFVSVPDAGLVLRLPIQRCDDASPPECEDGLIDEAGIARLRLPTVVEHPPAPSPQPQAPVEPAPAYEQLCGFERMPLPAPEPVDLAKLDEAVRMAPARPSALAVDAFCPTGESCTQRLLVADAAQPVIHAIDLDAWARGEDGLLDPIVTGVPTKDVAVTPRVPRALYGADETQYVYAIDAADGSVLVIEDGQVLNVNAIPGQRADRLLFNGGSEGALALEVMTPAFDVHGHAAQWVKSPTKSLPAGGDPLACTDLDLNHEEQNPARLRGVFLSAALTDGTIHVMDVHDMELRSSNGDEPCRACATSSSGPVPILVRHQQRLATSFVPLEGETQLSFVPAVTSLAFGVDGVSFGVRADGTTASPRAPGLSCMSCDSSLTRAYPLDSEDEPTPPTNGSGDEDAGTGSADGGLGLPADTDTCGGDAPALVCVSNDPWASGEDRWRGVYEGVLPTSVENRGRFLPADDSESGGLELVTESDSCAAGVLGAEDMGPDYPEGCAGSDNPAGDQVVITSKPLGRDDLALIDRGDEKTLGMCAALKNELDDNPKLRVAFEIRRAYQGRLVVNEAMVRSIGDTAGARFVRFADIRPCYDDTISFAVHSYKAFTVWGAESGFQHRVRANGAERCQIDPDPKLALRNGRARLGCEFRNSSLQFKLAPAPVGLDPAQLIGVELVTSFTSRATKLVMQAYNLGFGSASVVTEQLRYNDVDGRLFLVDINDRGLVPIPLDPFPPAVTTGAFN